MTDGPLDLTVPLNIAEVRAALATTGPLRRVGLAAYVAASKSTSAGSARPQDGQGGGHRRAGTRYPTGKPKRIGRIFAFVAVAAALSIGTAYALVLSNNAQNTSVSLPATEAIPVAPSASGHQSGQVAADSGSTSAQAAPSLSHSTGHQLPVSLPTTRRATPASSATATGTASTRPSTTASPSASAGAPTSTPPAGSDPTSPPGAGTQWDVLYEGQNEDSQTVQETSSVQSLLQELGFLQAWRHRSYIDPGYTVSADPNGYYGSATTQAIAEFQQDYGVDYTDQLGETDDNTYQTLVQAVQEAESE
jgi:Putative peptidoglycan binding domain